MDPSFLFTKATGEAHNFLICKFMCVFSIGYSMTIKSVKSTALGNINGHLAVMCCQNCK